MIAGQEYEFAHYALARFQQTLESVRTGVDLPGREIVNPQALAAAFLDARFLLDTDGRGHRLQQTPRDFPEHLKASSRRAVRNNRQRTLTQVRRHAARGDWFAFQSALVGVGSSALQALFAEREVYWTGDKWKRAQLVRLGFEPEIIEAYDRLWANQSPPEARLAALERLITVALAEAPGDEAAGQAGR